MWALFPDRSNEIITEYNARPDYLTAILKHKFGVKGHLGYLHIAQIDPQGKHILVLYHPPPSGDEVEFKIPLDPPVKTLFEIRPRMHEWRYAAFQHFQVVSLSTPSTRRGLTIRLDADDSPPSLSSTTTPRPPFSPSDCRSLSS